MEFNEFEKPEDFLLKLALYADVTWNGDQVFTLLDWLYFRGTIDCYCVKCELQSIFQGTQYEPPKELSYATYKRNLEIYNLPNLSTERLALNRPLTPEPPSLPIQHYFVRLQCTRNTNHDLVCIYLSQNKIRIEGGKKEFYQVVQKIGQFPSYTDLNNYQFSKYRKILKKPLLDDLVRGVGLASHDVGVGAYVYLRRVFEGLVSESYEKLKIEPGWDEEEYIRATNMRERIQLLADDLPKFVVENPRMYGLLSIGVHELTEEECLKHFDALKISIELILEQKLEQQNMERKEKEARSAIQKAIKGAAD